MNEAVLGHQVHDTVTTANLHGHREVISRFGREKHIDGFLRKHRIFWRVVNLNNVQFRSCSRAHSEREQFVRDDGVLRLELSKGSSMSFDRLRHTTLQTEQLHRPLDSERICIDCIAGDANQHHPLAVV